MSDRWWVHIFQPVLRGSIIDDSRKQPIIYSSWIKNTTSMFVASLCAWPFWPRLGCFVSVSRRRTTRQKERGKQGARKKPMPRAAATRTKAPWSSTRKARKEGINEKYRSPRRWGSRAACGEPSGGRGLLLKSAKTPSGVSQAAEGFGGRRRLQSGRQQVEHRGQSQRCGWSRVKGRGSGKCPRGGAVNSRKGEGTSSGCWITKFKKVKEKFDVYVKLKGAILMMENNVLILLIPTTYNTLLLLSSYLFIVTDLVNANSSFRSWNQLQVFLTHLFTDVTHNFYSWLKSEA